VYKIDGTDASNGWSYPTPYEHELVAVNSNGVPNGDPQLYCKNVHYLELNELLTPLSGFRVGNLRAEALRVQDGMTCRAKPLLSR
jgi:hypothetical protein